MSQEVIRPTGDQTGFTIYSPNDNENTLYGVISVILVNEVILNTFLSNFAISSMIGGVKG